MSTSTFSGRQVDKSRSWLMALVICLAFWISLFVLIIVPLFEKVTTFIDEWDSRSQPKPVSQDGIR